MAIPRPGTDEYTPYYGRYIEKVGGSDALAPLMTQRDATARFLATVPEARASYRYAPGKWSLREIIGHLSDTERIFSYRMLRIARGDETPLAGFDENVYVPAAGFARRSLADVAAEFTAVRDATIALTRSLDDAAAARHGSANGQPISARALAWIIAGHELHHLEVIGEKYLAK